jgi:hypothetical protein
MCRVLGHMNRRHLIVLQEEGWAGTWFIVEGNRLRLGATQFRLLLCLPASCMRNCEVLSLLWGIYFFSFQLERASERKAVSRAAYLRFEMRVRLELPQHQHVPLYSGQYGQMSGMLRGDDGRKCNEPCL